MRSSSTSSLNVSHTSQFIEGEEEEEEEEEEMLAWRLGYLVRALSRIFRIQMILYSYSNDTIQRSLSYSMRPRQTFYTISGSVRWRTSGPR